MASSRLNLPANYVPGYRPADVPCPQGHRLNCFGYLRKRSRSGYLRSGFGLLRTIGLKGVAGALAATNKPC
ncbi:hypothetical protein GCM10027511_04000 [Hymenobacter humi]